MNFLPLFEPRAGTLRLCYCVAAIATGGFFAMGADKVPPPANEPWVVPLRSARKANPIPADAKSIAEGKQLFTAGCLPCHGAAGKGDGPAAVSLERDGKPIHAGNLSDPKLWQQSDGAIFWKISEGKTPMPAFQESFSEEQRWQIVNYVRTLAPKQDNKTQETTSGGK